MKTIWLTDINNQITAGILHVIVKYIIKFNLNYKLAKDKVKVTKTEHKIKGTIFITLALIKIGTVGFSVSRFLLPFLSPLS